jgi:hypothetical protein
MKKNMLALACCALLTTPVLADEANLIAIESGRMIEGIKPSPEDRTRFLMAVGRFNHVWGLFA